MHERGLVEQWEHAVEALEEFCHERFALFPRWKRLKHFPRKYVVEDFLSPRMPFGLVLRDMSNHLVEGVVLSLLIDPLDAFG